VSEEINIEFAERIAKLEVLAEQSKKDQDALGGKMDSLSELLGEMKQDLAKYRGFWGGALLIISALWAFIELTGGWFVAKLRGEA
jgi:hypothetical protein